MMEWLRLYNEIIDDPKIAKMSDHQYRCFTYLLCIANTQDERGIIPLDIAEISWRIRMSAEDVQDTMSKLIELNIITNINDSYIFINWSKRQFNSDDINSRVKRSREKGRNVTGNVTCNVRDTDTDTDTEKIQIQRKSITQKSKERKKPLPPDFEISDAVKKWAAKKGYTNLGEHLESFISKCKANGYLYIDWDAAFMNAIHDNWAKIGENGNGNRQGTFRSQQTPTQKTGGAKSDGEPYPIDGEY